MTTHRIDTQPPLAMPLQSATAVIGLGRTSLFALSQSGDLETFMVGGRRMVSTLAIERFLARVDPARAANSDTAA